MKNFFKIVFGTFFALVVFTICLVLLCVGLAVSLVKVSTHKKTVTIEKGSYLVVDMSTNITDTPPPSENEQAFGKLFGGSDNSTVSLRGLLGAISQAGSDNRIKGIFLHGSLEPQGYGTGFAALKEVREALTTFHANSKKPVVAYLVSPSKRDYYLASVADRLYLNPFGEMDLTGLASEPTFYKGALDKYGIGVQVTRVGKFKSAVEPFLLQKMSPESREQTQQLLGDLWGQYKDGVGQSRQMTPDQIQTITDTDGIVTANVAKEKGLVTELAYLPEVIALLRKDAGNSTVALDKNTFKQVDLDTYIKDKVGKADAATAQAMASLGDTTPKLAVVYAEGDIVDGDSDANGNVAGDRFARAIRRLREDATVKGILLRVNSPGGSGLASEVIQHEMVLTRQAGKPVVVSMGTVAASGGYYISTAADRVFAEPNTITGSIGVFGILPNIQGIANNNGITFDSVSTGKYAEIFTADRPKNPEELGLIQHIVDDFYLKFKTRVATGRKLTLDQVETIAQGRVWAGEDALKIGLVDEMGGFEQALAYAKNKAGLATDAKIIEYPAPKDLAQQFAELFSGETKPLATSRIFGKTARTGPLGQQINQMQEDFETLARFNDPQGVYARLPVDLRVK